MKLTTSLIVKFQSVLFTFASFKEYQELKKKKYTFKHKLLDVTTLTVEKNRKMNLVKFLTVFVLMAGNILI